MSNIYINLHTRSYYSFLESSLSIDDIINFAVTNQYEYASLIDSNCLYGAIEFYKKCQANNLKPIIGIEINYQNQPLILIALNYDGYSKICQISSYIMTDSTFNLMNIIENDIAIIGLNPDVFFMHQNFYCSSDNVNGAKQIACRFVNCKNANDGDIIALLSAIKNDLKISKNELKQQTCRSYFLNDDVFKNQYNQEQLDNLFKLTQKINLVFPENISENKMIHFTKNQEESINLLRDLAQNNLQFFLNSNPDLNAKKYNNRLNYELDIIINNNFTDYFLVVQDFINWAKQKKIAIGPGRGSAAGSLVAFVLHITEIDPIKYNLLFERFLNINRITMPDIDTDVIDRHRDELIDYLFNKYGHDHVAHIATFSRIKTKQAIRDVGRVLEINPKIIDKISRLLTYKKENDFENNLISAINQIDELKDEYLRNKELFDYANKIINFPRQVGVHAAGIVLSNASLSKLIGIQRCLDNKTMLQISMDYLNELGLVKFDILGLRNLAILDDIIEIINKTRKININIHDIPLNDPKTYSLFQNGQTSGIFQFESDGMKKTLQKIKPAQIEDLSIASAIYRPGASRNIDLFIKNKEQIQRNPIKYLNKEIENILNLTSGVIVYQEQIIQLVQIVANFNPFQADQFRIAITKKHEEDIIKIKDDFLNGAIKNGYTIQDAEKIFETMLNFASYGFNHSHSISYAFISYWIAYLKTNFPLETISVLLSHTEINQEKLKSYINEAKFLSITIKKPDINISNTNFVIFKNAIFYSLHSIKDLGLESVKKIISLRNRQENGHFQDALITIAQLSAIGINKTMITNLIKAGAFDELEQNRDFLLINIDNLTNNKINLINKNNEFIFKFPILNAEYCPDHYYDYESEVLSVAFSKSKLEHLFDKYKFEYHLKHLKDVNEVRACDCLVKITKIYKNEKNPNNISKIEFYENNIKYLGSITKFSNDISLDTFELDKYYLLNIKKSAKNFYINKKIREINE